MTEESRKKMDAYILNPIRVRWVCRIWLWLDISISTGQFISAQEVQPPTSQWLLSALGWQWLWDVALLDLNALQKDAAVLPWVWPPLVLLSLHPITVVHIAFRIYPHPALNAALLPLPFQIFSPFSFSSSVFPGGAVEAQQWCLPEQGPLPFVLTLCYATAEGCPISVTADKWLLHASISDLVVRMCSQTFLRTFDHPAVALSCPDPAGKRTVLQFGLYGEENGNCINPLSSWIKCYKREKILKYIEPQRGKKNYKCNLLH